MRNFPETHKIFSINPKVIDYLYSYINLFGSLYLLTLLSCRLWPMSPISVFLCIISFPSAQSSNPQFGSTNPVGIDGSVQSSPGGVHLAQLLHPSIRESISAKTSEFMEFTFGLLRSLMRSNNRQITQTAHAAPVRRKPKESIRNECANSVVEAMIVYIEGNPGQRCSRSQLHIPNPDCFSSVTYQLSKLELKDVIKIKQFVSGYNPNNRREVAQQLMCFLGEFTPDLKLLSVNFDEVFPIYYDRMDRQTLETSASESFADTLAQEKIVCGADLFHFRFLHHQEFLFMFSLYTFLRKLSECPTGAVEDSGARASSETRTLDTDTANELLVLKGESTLGKPACDIKIADILKIIVSSSKYSFQPDDFSPARYRTLAESSTGECTDIQHRRINYINIEYADVHDILALLLAKKPTVRTAISEALVDHVPFTDGSRLIPLLANFDGLIRLADMDTTGDVDRLLTSLCTHADAIAIPTAADLESWFKLSWSDAQSVKPALILARVLKNYMTCGHVATKVEEESLRLLEITKQQLDFAERLANVVFTITRAGLDGVNAAIHINVLLAYIQVIEKSLEHIETHQQSHTQLVSKLDVVYQSLHKSVLGPWNAH